MYIFTAKVRQVKTTLQSYAKIRGYLYARGVKNDAKQSYTKTVLLPQTNFPARFSGKKRVEMDSYLIEVCLSHLFAVSTIFLAYVSLKTVVSK